jgi:hypothetical protein
MTTKIYHIASEILCFVFIALLVYTAVNKLMDHTRFKEQLMLVTGNNVASLFLSYLVPAAEVVIAGLLCFPFSRTVGLYLFCLLFLLFSGYILYLMSREQPLPCSCGGIISSMSWRQHLIFNICFLIASLALIMLRTTKIEAIQVDVKTKSF